MLSLSLSSRLSSHTLQWTHPYCYSLTVFPFSFVLTCIVLTEVCTYNRQKIFCLLKSSYKEKYLLPAATLDLNCWWNNVVSTWNKTKRQTSWLDLLYFQRLCVSNQPVQRNEFTEPVNMTSFKLVKLENLTQGNLSV